MQDPPEVSDTEGAAEKAKLYALAVARSAIDQKSTEQRERAP
jgi:hypothetical protein